MRILHVSQGVPPFRVGGLTRYCVDLMQEQCADGHAVSLLYPGHYSFGKTRISQGSRFHSISVYEIVNPLPLALVFGVNSPERYMKPCNIDIYEEYLKKQYFDVIHVHCTMGIHREFFQAANRLAIPLVFTTHDYYPLCPRCTMFTDECTLCQTADGEHCQKCNAGKGLSKTMEFLMQSRIYQKMKYSRYVSKLRAFGRRRVSGEKKVAVVSASAEEYQALLDYNLDILRMMTAIHCNSSLTREVYQKYLPELSYTVIPITHGELPEKRSNCVKSEHFRIVYLGGPGKAKGYSVLLSAVRRLAAKGMNNWSLELYGGDFDLESVGDSRIQSKGRYGSAEINGILHNASVVVVPSLWNETFGFVVLEALAAGVPVIASDRVGSKDLLLDAPIDLCFFANDDDMLANKLLEVYNHQMKLIGWIQKLDIQCIDKHANAIMELYTRIIGQ